MKFFPIGSPHGRGFRPAALLAIGLAAALAGCGTTTIEDALPGAVRTGIYPDLNIPQHGATRQLTDAEARSATVTLAAARDAQAVTTSTPLPSQAEQLRRLGAERAGKVLEEIEK